MRLGKYRLIAELGYGGMADVHLAVATGHANAQKLIVIKQLRQRMEQEDDLVNMFLDEGRLAVRLNHANVVQTFEVGVDDGRHFIVMEYLDGLALNVISRALRSQGGLPLAMHLRVLTDMLAGLDYAHNAEDFDGTPLGIVHRDVTPHNTFVTYDGQTKVVDFGIAKALGSSTQTTTGVIKGKISYMSPEQSRGEPLDRRSDVYAAGIMLWEAVTGARFWRGLADTAILQRLMTDQVPPSPREVKPELSELVVAVCARALAPRAGDRYATAAELQAGVEAILAELGQQHVTSRDVGKFITKFFAETRTKTKALIEAQMRLSPEEMTVLPELRQASWAPNSVTPPGGGGPLSGVEGAVVGARAGAGGGRRPGRAAAVLGGGVVLALAAGAGAAALSRPPVGRGPAALAAASDVAARPAGDVAAPRPARELVTVRFAASPPEAKLFLDGQLLSGNPFEGALPRDGQAHTLRAEAPGFQPKAHGVSLASDASLEVELERAPRAPEAREVRAGAGRPAGGRGGRPAAAVAAPAVPAAAAEPAASTRPSPTPVVLPKQAGAKSIVIDTSDPWKQKEKPQ